MNALSPNGTVNVVVEATQVVLHQKALVELGPGCIWTPLEQDGTPVGMAFAGQAKFAVDAFVETDEGVVGRAVAGSLQGIQLLFIQDHSAGDHSKRATSGDAAALGYADVDAFVRAVREMVDASDLHPERASRIDGAAVLIGRSDPAGTVVLVIQDDAMVFIHGSTVHIESTGRAVHIDEDRLVHTDTGHGRGCHMRWDYSGPLAQTIGRTVGDSIALAADAVHRAMCHVPWWRPWSSCCDDDTRHGHHDHHGHGSHHGGHCGGH